LKQKKLYEGSLEYFFTKKASLEEQLIQIKSMSDSVQVMNILKECDKVNKILISDSSDMENVIENIRSNKEDMSDLNEHINQYSNDNFNNDIESELQMLQDEISKGKNEIFICETDKKIDRLPNLNNNEFPSVRKEPSLNELLRDFEIKK